MKTYASPRPGYCASCEGFITGRPVVRMEQSYCCIGCARGELCVCTYEADMADDGVDGLGLLFSVPQDVAPEPVREAQTVNEAEVPAKTEHVPSPQLVQAGIR